MFICSETTRDETETAHGHSAIYAVVRRATTLRNQNGALRDAETRHQIYASESDFGDSLDFSKNGSAPAFYGHVTST